MPIKRAPVTKSDYCYCYCYYYYYYYYYYYCCCCYYYYYYDYYYSPEILLFRERSERVALVVFRWTF